MTRGALGGRSPAPTIHDSAYAPPEPITSISGEAMVFAILTWSQRARAAIHVARTNGATHST